MNSNRSSQPLCPFLFPRALDRCGTVATAFVMAVLAALVAPGPLAAQSQGATSGTQAGSGTAKGAQGKTAPAPKGAAAAKGGTQDGKGQPKADAKKDDPKAKPTVAAPGGGQATLLAKYGDWGAYATQGSGKSKICYALSQPTDRQPKTLTRDPGYIFVSFRPTENVKNEIAVMMGFPTKDGGAAEAVVGTTSYPLITKEQNAWVKNPAEEAQVITTMSKAQSLVVKASSKRGNQTADRYSLNGFGPAIERVRKECP